MTTRACPKIECRVYSRRTTWSSGKGGVSWGVSRCGNDEGWGACDKINFLFQWEGEFDVTSNADQFRLRLKNIVKTSFTTGKGGSTSETERKPIPFPLKKT